MSATDGFPDFDDDIPAKPVTAAEKTKPKLKLADAAEEVGVTLTVGLSEDALADSFCTSFNGQWKYVREWSRWFTWRKDIGWQPEGKKSDEEGRETLNERNALAFQTIREFLRGAAHWDIAGQITWAARQKLCSVRHCQSVMTFTQHDNRFVASTDQFDDDDYLLGVPGGVVDLRSGVMRENRQKDYITKRCAIYPEDGPTPEYDKFMAFYTSDSAEKRDYLDRLCGMCLTGDRREQSFTFFYGGEGAGKGTFLRMLIEILHDYAVTCDADTFLVNKMPTGTEDIARLAGARIAVVDETPESCMFNEKRIKSATGGGKLTARRLYEGTFEFKPRFRLIFAANNKPIIRGTGAGMRRRLHLFPCLGKVAVADQDKELENKLRAEYPQILARWIKGCKVWQERGLLPPEEMQQAAAAYLESEDTVADWVSDRCEQPPLNRLNRVDAYKDYKRWCVGQGKEHAMGDRAFYENLETKGFKPGRSAGMRYHLGLELKPREGSWNHADDE